MGILGIKRVFVLTGAFLMATFLPFGVSPSSGMDALTQMEMGELSGQSGFSMAFCGTSTLKMTFNSMSYGDPDGCFAEPGAVNAQVNNPGFIVLIGDDDADLEQGELNTVIEDGTVLTIDVGTTGASTCSPGDFGGILIPKYTPFFTFTLSKIKINLIPPETVDIRGTNDPTKDAGDMDMVGRMYPVNLAIDKPEIPGRGPSRCYVWVN